MTDTITLPRSVVEQALAAFSVATTPLARDRQEVLGATQALRAALKQPDMGNPVSVQHQHKSCSYNNLHEKTGHLSTTSSSVPEGWKLVPVEPTQAMMDAMQSSGWLTGCYRAMLAAAPHPPALEQPQVEQEPVAWLHTDWLGGKQAFTFEPPPSMKQQCQPLYTHPQHAVRILKGVDE